MTPLSLAGYVAYALIGTTVLVAILVWVERFAAWLDEYWGQT